MTNKPAASAMTETGLPVTRDLRRSYQLSLLIVILTAAASIAGLLAPDALYPTPELRQSFLPNDLINLIIGLPILLGSMWLARRGSLAGLLFWPGALFYGLYNYLIYLISIPLSILSFLNLVIVILSVIAITDLLSSIDTGAVKKRLGGHVPERLAGGPLFLFGAVFLLRSAGIVASALASQTQIVGPEIGVLISDAVLSIPWIVGGALLWLRRARGYVWGSGLLFQASSLFIGLIAILLLGPLLTDAPFAIGDVVVVAVMSLVCLIPFGLFIRGIARS
jgi:hypothetical protein